jgi:hypothetical protein
MNGIVGIDRRQLAPLCYRAQLALVCSRFPTLSVCFAHNRFVCSTKTMACCSPLGVVAAPNVAEAKNMGETEIVMEVVPAVGR